MRAVVVVVFVVDVVAAVGQKFVSTKQCKKNNMRCVNTASKRAADFHDSE